MYSIDSQTKKFIFSFISTSYDFILKAVQQLKARDTLVNVISSPIQHFFLIKLHIFLLLKQNEEPVFTQKETFLHSYHVLIKKGGRGIFIGAEKLCHDAQLFAPSESPPPLFLVPPPSPPPPFSPPWVAYVTDCPGLSRLICWCTRCRRSLTWCYLLRASLTKTRSQTRTQAHARRVQQ